MATTVKYRYKKEYFKAAGTTGTAAEQQVDREIRDFNARDLARQGICTITHQL